MRYQVGDGAATRAVRIDIIGAQMKPPTAINTLQRRLCVAPMMDVTDRHQRYLMRLLSSSTVLYTEMITARAIVHGDRRRLLDFDSAEHPVALQIGGSEPDEMRVAARAGEDAGYDEVNINVGCPSDRVKAGRFGACLMAEPQRVADCVAAMRAAIAAPVTVKTRIGLDRDESPELLHRLVEACAAAGCETFIVHARNAWLSGLSPRENREIPPLRYEVVRDLKAGWPQLDIVLNGGVSSLDEAGAHLTTLDGVMMGRAVWANPFLLADADSRVFGARPRMLERSEVLQSYLPHVARQLSSGVPFAKIVKPLMGLYLGQPGARTWRRLLAEAGRVSGAGLEELRSAARAVAPAQPI